MDDLKNLRQLLSKADEIEVQFTTILKDIKKLNQDNVKTLKLKEELSEKEIDLILNYSQHRADLEETIIVCNDNAHALSNDYVNTFKKMQKEMDDFTDEIKKNHKQFAFTLLQKIGGAILFSGIGYAVSHYELISYVMNLYEVAN